MTYKTPHIKLKDYFLTQEEFEIRIDEKTEILKTFPQPEQLDRYYESENYLSHSSSKKTLFERCYNWAKERNLKSKLNLFKKYVNGNEVLDIGSGIGDLGRELNQSGFHATGIEPSLNARKVALEQEINLLADSSTLLPYSFDAISMYHVLEHVPNIEKQKAEILSLLKENGILILALPNYNSLDAQWFGKYWAGYDVPRHLFHFNPKAVHNFFNAEFEIQATHPLWFDSLYVSILSARYKKWPIPFISGIIVGLCSNLSALFTKEYSSITYVLKKRK